MKEATIKPIAHVLSDFKEKFGIPRQSGRAPSVLSTIVFEPEFRDKNALLGIEGFSHIWVIFDFSLAHKEGFSPTVRPPRLGGNQRVGVFASRSPFRPNNLGLSSGKLVRVEEQEGLGSVLIVSGLDLLDGTPIYDIKPYLPFTDCHVDAVGGYADEKKDYKLKVQYLDDIDKLLPPDLIPALTECLADDPRPSYQEDGREYGMRFADFNVKFKVEDNTLIVFDISKCE
ncbi:MAG: tRNA (N6-threonylcarbamoyladenosine(37)-N6)-methyltransferase TrmO [Clostridia bacterium]|nr:tRNA (N6-threonylcarbamoyladenosine(37)-N6)-methyltransferase TrmO [Clostridia bacterium]